MCQGTCGIVPDSSCQFDCVQQYTSGFEVLACSIDTDFNYAITIAPESPPRSDISNPKLPLPTLSPTKHLLGGKNGLIKVLF